MMKKTLTFICALFALVACNLDIAEVVDTPAVDENQEVKLNITISREDIEPATKATVKKDWETNDVVFLLFSSAAAPKYIEMKYNGSSWVATKMNSITDAELAQEAGGSKKMTAIYLPYGSNYEVAKSGTKFLIQESLSKSNYCGFFYMSEQQEYTYNSTDGLTATIYLTTPRGETGQKIVHFDVTGYDAAHTYAMTQDYVCPITLSEISKAGAVTKKLDGVGSSVPGYIYNGHLCFSGMLDASAVGVAKDYRFVIHDKTNGTAYRRTNVGNQTIRTNNYIGIGDITNTGNWKKITQKYFSVGPTTLVQIAPGNLVATVTAVNGEGAPTAVTWSFHANQYDRVFGWDGTQTLNQGDKIDLFGWGTSGWDSSSDPSWVHFQPWSLSKEEDQSDTYPNNKWGYGPGLNAEAPGLTGIYAHGDWGVHNAIGGDPAGTWRLPTLSEFEYLLNASTSTSPHRTTKTSGLPTPDINKGTETHANWLVATVDTIIGTIVFPDYYEHPSDCEVTIEHNFYGYSVSTTGNDYSHFVVDKANWSKMENAGAIFFPITGVRNGNNVQVDLTQTAYGKMFGFYWSSSRYSTAAAGYSVGAAWGYHFAETGSGKSGERTYVGFAVRLIKDL